MDAQPRLWGLGTGRTLRPIWTLFELGVAFELEPILTRSEAMERPDFMRLSGRGKIPLLEVGDLVIGESAAISLHLADRYRDGIVLTPEAGTRDRLLHDELCWFIMTEMDAILYTIRRHEGLPEIYGASEVAVQAARGYFLRSTGEIERRLEDQRSYLLGEHLSVADILATSCFQWAALVCKIGLPPLIGAYTSRCAERTASRLALQCNFPPEALAALQGGDTPEAKGANS